MLSGPVGPQVPSGLILENFEKLKFQQNLLMFFVRAQLGIDNIVDLFTSLEHFQTCYLHIL